MNHGVQDREEAVDSLEQQAAQEPATSTDSAPPCSGQAAEQQQAQQQPAGQGHRAAPAQRQEMLQQLNSRPSPSGLRQLYWVVSRALLKMRRQWTLAALPLPLWDLLLLIAAALIVGFIQVGCWQRCTGSFGLRCLLACYASCCLAICHTAVMPTVAIALGCALPQPCACIQNIDVTPSCAAQNTC